MHILRKARRTSGSPIFRNRYSQNPYDSTFVSYDTFFWMDRYVVLNTSPVDAHPCLPKLPVFVSPSWTTRLDAHRARLLRRLQSTARGPGPVYLLKAFLPWLLPEVERAVVLDFDLLCVQPIAQVWEEFGRFSPSHVMGAAQDIASSKLYPNSEFGVNGGVQLLHLGRMRSGPYEAALETISHTREMGYLGDQTLYTALSDLHPLMLFRLSCRFNRQLNRHFALPAEAYACADGCAIVHGNQPSWKHVIRSASGVFRRLPPFMRGAFRNCHMDSNSTSHGLR